MLLIIWRAPPFSISHSRPFDFLEHSCGVLPTTAYLERAYERTTGEDSRRRCSDYLDAEPPSIDSTTTLDIGKAGVPPWLAKVVEYVGSGASDDAATFDRTGSGIDQNLDASSALNSRGNALQRQSDLGGDHRWLRIGFREGPELRQLLSERSRGRVSRG